MTPEDSGDTLTSGAFARRTRLSGKALRIYDEMGLLRPAAIDPANGYRRYSVDQVRTGRLVAMLRGADVSLVEIGAVLGALEHGSAAAVQRIEQHLVELEIRHSSRRALIRHIHAVLREEDPMPFSIETRHVGALRVMSMQRRLRASETDGFVTEARTAFADHLQGAAPTGPFMLLFHGIVDHENDGPLEAVLVCPDSVQPTDLIGVRTEPAHDEAFTTITKAQWAYPAILAAYDAVACSPEAVARGRSRLSCREVYLAHPDATGDDEPICDIAFPLG